MIQPEKCCNKDVEIGINSIEANNQDSNDNLNDETQIDETDMPKRRINPFKLVWDLCKNKVNIYKHSLVNIFDVS
jgi:hypothetical protein